MSIDEPYEDIARDADEYSISHSASHSQTTVGLGMVSGRAIQAVGELALRGIAVINITVTLRRIASRVRRVSAQGKLASRDVHDLLELQRYVVIEKCLLIHFLIV